MSPMDLVDSALPILGLVSASGVFTGIRTGFRPGGPFSPLGAARRLVGQRV